MLRLNHFIDWFLVAAIALAIPQLFLLLSGETFLAISSDAQLHLDRTIAMTIELQNGYVWPRWSHALHGAYGSPLFNYYSPAVYLIGGSIHLITGLAHEAILSLLIVVILLMRPLGAYLFTRQFVDPPSALTAAAIYTFVPFHFRELLIQVNIPQFMALALLPFILWTVVKAIKVRHMGWLMVSSFLFAGLIITHQLTAFLFAPVIIGFAVGYGVIFASTWQQRLKNVGFAGLGIGIGILLSTIYWLPALSELSLTQIDTIQDQTFTIDANYIDLSLLLAPITMIDQGWLNWQSHYGSFGPRIGQAHLAIIGLTFVALLFHPSRKIKGLTALSVLLAIFSLFMITPASEGLWDVFPLMGYVQFPWRWLIIFGVATILPTAFIINTIPERWRTISAGGFITGIFIVTIPMFYAPVVFMPSGTTTPADMLEREQLTGNIATTASNEYLPKWASVAPLRILTDTERETLQAGEWRIWIEETSLPEGAVAMPQSSTQRGTSIYQITTEQPFNLIFKQLYFPAWEVRINGERQPINPTGENGLIGVHIPAGSHTLSIRYGGTPIQKTATMLSLFGISIFVIAGCVVLIRRHPTHSPQLQMQTSPPRLAYGVIGCIIIFIVLDAVLIRPHTNLFRPQSPPDQPPAQYLVDIPFGDTVALVGYDITPQAVDSGQTIHIRLYWRLLKPATADMLRSSIHITSRYGISDYGGSNAFHIGAIPIERWTDYQYVTDEHFLLIEEGIPPFLTEIRVSVFDGENNDLLTKDGERSVVIDTVNINGDWHIIASADLVGDVIHFADKITLLGHVLQTNNEQTCLTLRWRVEQDHLPELAVMLHLLDADHNLLQALDAAPLNDLYPTNHWLKDQQLDDKHCFTVTAETERLLLGLYDRATLERLTPISADGEPFINHAVPVTLNN